MLKINCWDNAKKFLCEFDGPREERNIVVTIIETSK